MGLLTDQARRLDALRSIRRLLDDAYRIPGTPIRFGWDPLIGLIPGLGDLVTGVLSCAIIVEAHRMRVPRVVVARMVLNIGIDLIVGVLPLVGDAADVFWKANSRNMALLERHAAVEAPASIGDWVFVIGILAFVVVMAVLPLIVMYWLVHRIFG